MAAEAEPAAETGGALSQQDAAELEAPEADGNEAQADGDEGPGRGAGVYETRLAEAEERIAEARQRYNAAEKDGLEAAADVGHELMGVCRRQWYRVAGYETFEAYALARHGYSRPQAYRLIDVAQVRAALSPVGDKLSNERQARELAPLKRDPKLLARVWRRARKDAGGAEPTAEQIRDARMGLTALPKAPRSIAPAPDASGSEGAAVESHGARTPVAGQNPQSATAPAPAVPPAEPEVPAGPAAVVTVVPGQVITEPPPAVPAETLRRLAVVPGMSTDRAEAGLAALTPAELTGEITSELKPASASPEAAEPEVPAVAPADVEVALRVLMSAAGMDRQAQERWAAHLAQHGGSLPSAAGVIQAIQDAMTRQGLHLPGPEPARRLRSAVALAHSTRSPRELWDMLGGMPAGELAAAAEAVSALGDRLTQAAWLAGDAEARAMSSS